MCSRVLENGVGGSKAGKYLAPIQVMFPKLSAALVCFSGFD